MARDVDVLDEDVRREQGQAGDRVAGGVDERDRGAVAVADEQRLGRVELREQRGQHVLGLLVEEGRGARAGGGSERPWPKREKATTRRPVAAVQGLREVRATAPPSRAPRAGARAPRRSPSPGQVGDLDVEPVDHGHRASLVAGPRALCESVCDMRTCRP